MNRKKMMGIMKGVGRDLLMAVVVVIIVMLVLYSYCGIWPPMVVVESGSMEHPPSSATRRSYVGVIDTGDMVFVKEVGDYDLKSYVDGEAAGYSTYGSYGDVVIYRPDGEDARTPIIHRLVVWIEPNATLAMPAVSGRLDISNYTFDIPSLGIYGSVDDVVLHDYGYRKQEVTISLVELRDSYGANRMPHAGFVTMGDNNVPRYDQPGYELVQEDWIVGRAIGELPWFGLIKLSFTKPNPDAPMNSWINLFTLIFLVLFIPLFFDFGLPLIKKKWKARGARSPPTKPPEEKRPDEAEPETPPEPPREEGGDAKPTARPDKVGEKAVSHVVETHDEGETHENNDDAGSAPEPDDKVT